MRVSFLHLGQNNGNFTSTVSLYTFVLVFPPQIGQCIHRDLFRLSSIYSPPHVALLCVLRLAFAFICYFVYATLLAKAKCSFQ